MFVLSLDLLLAFLVFVFSCSVGGAFFDGLMLVIVTVLPFRA